MLLAAALPGAPQPGAVWGALSCPRLCLQNWQGRRRQGLPVLGLACPANRNLPALPGPLRLCPVRNVAVADVSCPKAGQKTENTEVLH